MNGVSTWLADRVASLLPNAPASACPFYSACLFDPNCPIAGRAYVCGSFSGSCGCGLFSCCDN
jgi:hypothetical protein